MELRKTDITDISTVMNIIRQAQEYFKAQGINQWQNNYPNEEAIKDDIKNGYAYVLTQENTIIATVALIFDKDVTYQTIYDGAWIGDTEYAVIHRIAVSSDYKGLGIASILLKYIEEMCLNKGIQSIRVDTHEGNLPMKRLLAKNKFQYCGIIYLEDGNKRAAYEKILEDNKESKIG